MIILKEILEDYNNGNYSGKKARKIARQYAKRLEAEGWTNILLEGAVFSPDKLAVFYYGRDSYIGQMKRGRFGDYREEDDLLQYKYEQLIEKYLENFDVLPENNDPVRAKLKGYVSHEKITNYIKENINAHVVDSVERTVHCPLCKCNWVYTVNEHSKDQENYYSDSGFIEIEGDDCRCMFRYEYTNITTVNQFTNPNYFRQIVEPETTELCIWNATPSQIELLKEIVKNLSGGWICENSMELYYSII